MMRIKIFLFFQMVTSQFRRGLLPRQCNVLTSAIIFQICTLFSTWFQRSFHSGKFCLPVPFLFAMMYITRLVTPSKSSRSFFITHDLGHRKIHIYPTKNLRNQIIFPSVHPTNQPANKYLIVTLGKYHQKENGNPNQ